MIIGLCESELIVGQYRSVGHIGQGQMSQQV